MIMKKESYITDPNGECRDGCLKEFEYRHVGEFRVKYHFLKCDNCVCDIDYIDYDEINAPE